VLCVVGVPLNDGALDVAELECADVFADRVACCCCAVRLTARIAIKTGATLKGLWRVIQRSIESSELANFTLPARLKLNIDAVGSKIATHGSDFR
jgi:hypothetical protein